MAEINLKSFNQFRFKILSGAYLFSQNTPVDSVFFIVSGFVILCNGEWEQESSVNYVGPGEVLGEQLLFGVDNTKRFYSAKANTDVECIKITSDQIAELRSSNPELFIQLLQICGKTCHQRLMRANSLIHCFKYDKKQDRLMHLMLYLFDTFGRKTAKGNEVYLPSNLFRFYISIDTQEIELCLKELATSGIITSLGNDLYLLKNRLALMQKLPQIVSEIPSFPII